MEISDVKRRVIDTIERAKTGAADRRARAAEAGRAYEQFLADRAVPIFRQVANVLRAQGFHFSVFTPAGAVRLASDRSGEDYVELTFDTEGAAPTVVGRSGRNRGRRTVEAERALGHPEALSDDDVLSFVLGALEPLVER